MSDADKIQAGRELQDAADEFIGALRLARGMDETAFARLADAIKAFGAAWEAESHLPKSGVNALVGLFSWIDSASCLYGGDEARRIRQAAVEAESLIFRHVVPAPAPDG
ncbi:hypothetical protein GT755_01740 [Herbidospora sp. NEAU-GS84]|uniref:Uncharacterized protein n=1 Tax=Herbidospora solisilvae TaxID=2696284 RepID=A0A7C9J9H5_9ACTN|nr:hypothetical protein [Herbidospora solisilvae]NAS20404.1 hypothetical protein [Herbidospora solisilvae]